MSAANTFTGNQTVNGNLTATGVVSGSSYQIGSNLFAFGSAANGNAFLGFAGNTTMTGIDNIATGSNELANNTTGTSNTTIGGATLFANSTGFSNTATGEGALNSNTTGAGNTAVGVRAIANNTTGDNNTASGSNAGAASDNSALTGSNNTFLRWSANPSTGTLINATAVGAQAEVGASNSMVLGSISGLNGATANTNVGIGTTTPSSQLDVEGNAPASSAPILELKNNAPTQSGATGNSIDLRFSLDSLNVVGNPNAYIRAQEDGKGNFGAFMSFATVADGGSSATERLRLASNGNVGIGTTSPQSTLDVLASSNSVHALIGNVGCGPANAGIIFATTLNPNCQTYAISGDSSGNTYVDAPGGSLHFRISPNTDAMIIDPSGNVSIVGNLSKGSGSFKIDHPLDPANKYLYHSFVESPDMMNVYNGNFTTNGHCLAVVTLPDYFEALNRDFRYQLTLIGQFAQAIVAREISRNQFTIRTSRPNVKVSWQITGIRHDAYADAHRIPVEEEKPLQERGKYLHPELFGEPAAKSIAAANSQPSPSNP